MDITYKGTSYHGWQIQPNGMTVQEEIEKALSTILKTKVSILGSGRTDAGVHATQQIAHFDAESIDVADLSYKLNSFLPNDLSINSITPVKKDAHARFDATKRTYFYHIHQTKQPFKQETSYYFNGEIDIVQIQRATEIIGSWQNFECFSKVHTEVNNFICQIFLADWSQEKDNHLFKVSANRFLRGMVRAMVGTLLDVGTGKTSLDQFEKILESGDRKKAGRAVPAHGLFLEEVEYPKTIFN